MSNVRDYTVRSDEYTQFADKITNTVSNQGNKGEHSVDRVDT